MDRGIVPSGIRANSTSVPIPTPIPVSTLAWAVAAAKRLPIPRLPFFWPSEGSSGDLAEHLLTRKTGPPKWTGFANCG